jgi:formamidopyrimidine-DNA glycosylase
LKQSAKAFLATKQRIPGLGNGVLQDILFNARVHPKRKMSTLTDKEMSTLFDSVKNTLFEMTAKGGRDTERDLFGCSGGYRTILSAKTIDNPCPVCGGKIVREAYLGGNIYYCPECQKLDQ